MSRQIPWARISAESVAIVVSILLAFGIQAWWEGAGEARTRHALLEGLRADFELAEAQLDSAAALVQVVRVAAERWLDLGRSADISPLLGPVADSLMTDLLFVSGFDPPVGAVEALISGGDMSLIGDPALASDLRAWMAQVASYKEREAYAVQVYHDQLMPFLLGSDVPVADLAFSPRMDPDYPLSPIPTDAYLLLADRRFQGIVSNVWYARADIRNREETLRGTLQRIRGRLAER